MIAWLKGVIREKYAPKLVIDVSGVGYEVETSMNTFFKLPDIHGSVTLMIYTQIREDAHCLYGFYDNEERALFKALIKVNGVGPKLALSILSSVTPSIFCDYIQSQNIDALVKLPGIGKKTAERLYIEMQHRIDDFRSNESVEHKNNILTKSSAHNDAIIALKSLGYKTNEISRVLKQISDDSTSSEKIIRQALQALAI
jgi:holliday junction DNA helicase RuvA